MRTAPRRHVFLSCGEASGDRYGAALLSALRERDPYVRCTALGGSALAAAGAEIVQSSADLAVMGFGGVVGALPAILRARRRIWRHLADGGVDLVVPIDFPGFNLRVARRARKLGLPVFYLVPPQLWAWGAWRIGGLRRSVDRLGTILPFEADWFAERGVDVFPMGHPLVEDYGGWDLDGTIMAREQRFASEEPLTLLLLPGSRRQEAARLASILKVSASIVAAGLGRRSLRVVVSRAPGMDGALLRDAVGAGVDIRREPLPVLLKGADLALVCSGTASLEAALAGVPHDIVYRTGALDYALARRLVRVDRFGLANLILGEDLVPEHLQEEVAPVPLARSLQRWVHDAGERRRFYAGVRRLREACGPPGVWSRTAEALLDHLDRQRAARR
ncbi:MAG: lipid-A-disaccharide synthase [Candidatus Krumholzibacteriia bacterium]